MKNSDIFNNFVKIATERGLLSTAKDEPKETNLKNPRWDSRSAKDIEKMYNTKPKAPSDMEYEHDVMEIAHPKKNPLIISPAHDKINGLIESEQEGQNIRIHIVQKNNNGQLIQNRLAEKTLTLSLVRLANELDIKGNEKLCKLADICLEQLTNKSGFQKKAFPVLITIIAGLFGAYYLQQHIAKGAGNIIGDAQKLDSDIQDFFNSNSNWGVGQDYSRPFLDMLNVLRMQVRNFDQVVKETLPIIQNYQLPKTGKELATQAQSADGQQAAKALETLNAAYQEVHPFFNKVIAQFSNESYKAQQIEHKGILTDLVDQTKILHGGWGLVRDDFDDVVMDLKQYVSDTQGLFGALQKAANIKSKVAEELYQESQYFEKVNKPVVEDASQSQKPGWTSLPDLSKITSLE